MTIDIEKLFHDAIRWFPFSIYEIHMLKKLGYDIEFDFPYFKLVKKGDNNESND